ncbi:GNAT family N-acetyltransferase [Mucilaginibacter sp.]|uniref:GNAT family N-acetyltransferase n=2 Tax=Mucilaginibacter sp. TaxID=1882438 RepID=UPI00326701F4
MAVFMNDTAFLKKGYEISLDKAKLDFDAIYSYLTTTYWAKGMPAEKLKTALENSMCFGLYHNGSQVGLSRVVTDQATFAYLCDVYVLETHRGIGLSKWMMQTILAHPDLQGLRRWSLATADAQGLYSQFGFTRINNPENWMQIHTPYKAD